MIRKIFLIKGIVLFIGHLGAMLPSFDEGMGSDYQSNPWMASKRFKKIYENYHYEKGWEQEIPIPNIIHQIWLGGEVPEKFKHLMRTWQDQHPDWTYCLWTDESLKAFTFLAKRPFDVMKNLGGKSDILRYEILYKMGGVYVDCDFECLKPLDDLVKAHSFFAGIGGKDYINNAIIGSKPFHPIIKKLLDRLNDQPNQNLTLPWYHTGPKFFTFHVYQYLKEHPEEGVIYPVSFFYPLPNTYRFDYREGKLSENTKQQFIKPYSFAIHYWAESWNQ